ncbi:hypothetical protein KKH27_11075 [bacterium]|nr:hypothetical protein [bacterium]MBU1985106.1 hypothetical protein [bacterium]
MTNRLYRIIRQSSRMETLLLVWLVCFLPVLALAAISETEPNNDFEHANPVSCGDSVVCATLVPATDFDHYRIHVLSGDSLILRTFPCQNSQTNTLIVLFDDRDSVLAVDDDSGPMWFSQIRYRTPRTADYFVRVLKHPATPDSAYGIVFQCPFGQPEDYDRCETPRIVPSFPYYNEGSTLGQTHQCGTAAPDVFYKFTLPAVSNVFVTVCTDAFDARVQILGGCCRDFLDDADTGCGLGAELISFNLAAGDYYILVEGTSAGQAGNFSIEVDAALPGCPAPYPVVLTEVGNLPLLDWPEFSTPDYYVIWHSPLAQGPWEHLGVSFLTYFIDSSGFTATRKFYKVTSVCPW